MTSGSHVDIGDVRLHVVERGSGFPVIVLHGGPGLDHHMFADYLDPLSDDHQLLLVDQRGQGQSDPGDPAHWTLVQMAADVSSLANALALERFVVLGHSYGAFVALQHAVDFAGEPAGTIVSSGLASARWLDGLDGELAAFEPADLREQVSAAWAREAEVRRIEDVATLMADQMPFHFRDPRDPRIDDYNRRSSGMVGSPDVLRTFATAGYGGIDVLDRLADVRHPVLVLAGRFDRTCPVAAAEEMAAALPNAELRVFENSGHMTFVEEQKAYLAEVHAFVQRLTESISA